MNMNYRHELKFFVTDKELEVIRYRLQPLMRSDTHQNGNSYMVRSLYFDDFQNSCKMENEAGIGNRRKFRIRIYNGDDTLIKLEQKIKYWDRVRKEAVLISKEDCLAYMNGNIRGPSDNCSKTESALYVRMKVKGMRPVCIVEYERTAWVEPRGNVRITFDKNIGGSSKAEHFLDERISLMPLLSTGIHILEIKYDTIFPQYLYEVLNAGTYQRCSFSKYYYARRGNGLSEWRRV